jgi:hypothetical protein
MFIETGLSDVTKQQYYLSKHCNISISESNLMPDFERELFYMMLVNEIEEENKEYSKRSSRMNIRG